jgi:PAS domain S-box-containing protein
LKHFFNHLSEKIVGNFGFDNNADFSASLLHVKLLFLTIPVALISSFIENYFGLQAVTLIAFITLIILELVTGISASRKRNIPIQSKKFSRFGFKLGIWFTIFFILQTMKLQYKDNAVIGGIYGWLHSSIFIYVTLEYLISVIENVSVITGEKNNVILNMIKGSIGKYMKQKEDEAEEFFQVNDELLCVLTADGNFKKINKAWIEALGYDEKTILNKNFKDYVHPEDLSKTKKEYEKLKTSGSLTGLVNRYKTKDGSYINLSWNAKGGKNGVFYCTTKVVID